MDNVDGVGSRSERTDDAADDQMDCVDEEVEYVLDDKPQMVRLWVSECLPSIWHVSFWLLLHVCRHRSGSVLDHHVLQRRHSVQAARR